MTVASVRPDDIIHADHHGERFYGRVADPDQHPAVELRRGELLVHPISNGHASVRIVKAREVVGHWRASARTRKARAA
jgi:hypothetical protein